MNLFRPAIKVSVMLVAIGLLHNSCMTDDLNLSDGINTEVTLGGDSLSVPIGSVQPITLGSMLDSLGVDLIQKSTDESYSLNMNDSTEAVFSSIDPININIAPVSVPDITTSLSEISFPEFSFSPIQLNSNINVPVVSTSALSIPGINAGLTPDSISLSAPNSVKGINKAKSDGSVTFGPYAFSGSNDITQSINFTFDNNLKKINKIYLKNSVVTISFDKSSINKLGFDSQDAKITTFQIDFPAEYHISTPSSGASVSSDGRSFIISNADISASSQNTFTYSFVIDYIDFSNIPQIGWLSYNANIHYTMSASFSGMVSSGNAGGFYGKKISMGVGISAAPQLDDLDMTTNDISMVVPAGNNNINQTINNIPTEVSQIDTLLFKNGAKLDISISNLNLTPFAFSGGNCVIQLPQAFVFKPTSGLNTTTNVLTIASSELLGYNKTLEISKLKLNATVSANHSITVSDALSYNISGLTIGGTTTKLSNMQSIGGLKTLAINANISGLLVQDAVMKTNRVNISVPSSTASITLHQKVADYVKKLYTLKMKNPVSIALNISVTGLNIDSLFFDNYKIQLPSSMKFTNSDLTNNVLTLNSGFKTSEGFTKTLILDSFDFGTNGITLTSDGYLDLNEAIKLNEDGTGKVYIKSSTLKAADLSGVTVIVKPSITLGTMALSLIEGQINPTIDPIKQSIQLDLPDVLKNPANNFDIDNPVIKFQIGNTLGLPMELDLNITPKRNGQPLTDGIVSVTIPIAKASTIGQFTWSKLYLAKDTTAALNSGYKGISVPKLPNLLSTIPDEIEIEATPRVTGTRQTVDLYSPNNTIKLKYDVNVPLKFGEKFRLQYQDTINNLKESLSQFAKYAKQVDVVAVVSNGIPLNLKLEMKPLDSNGNIISDVEVNISDSIKSSRPKDGMNNIVEAVQSKISLGIKDKSTNGDAFGKIDGFAIKISASKNSNTNGIPLKADQSVGLDLRVSVPKGITIDLDSSKNK